MTRVFISYCHDSPAHKDRVLALANRLRGEVGDRVSLVIDQDRFPGGPDEGWPAWSERQVSLADRVLVIGSQGYQQSYDGKGPKEVGLGTACEAAAIRQALYNKKGVNPKFRVVLFEQEHQRYIPQQLQGYHHFGVWQPAGYSDLVLWLRGERKEDACASTPGARAPIPWPTAPVALVRGAANREREFDCFERTLRGQSRERVILVKGQSGRGKTHLLSSFFELARLLGVACAKVDLKGGPPLEEVFDMCALDLSELLPNSTKAQGSARGTELLRDLEQVAVPVLLAFDNYEQGTDELWRWLETRLLARIDRCPALIAVVSGKQIPDSSKHSWRELSRTFDLGPIEKVDDWLKFCAVRYAGAALTTEYVEALALAARGEPEHVSLLLSSLAESLQSQASNGGRT